MFFLLLRGLWGFVQVWLLAVVVLLALLGAVAVADVWIKPDLPHIRVSAQPRVWWQFTGRRTWMQADALDDAGRWAALQPALRILDEVCPEVAEFTRERWASGHLVFEREDRGRYAAWYVLPRTLVINYVAWEFGDAELACTLAHEFRHSRQGYLRGLQLGIGRLFGVDRSDLVEDEAYEWEGRVRRAIRGQR